ncbi:LLM class F420-dependent oxidoreductase [Streptomyces pseudovenezuelae]|uniref:F420-dependent oxidoreductase n=1 Tax=Streptomyces pseudovenezuelae TaxID=67350 RepID=A0ABT6LI51_9ACTN|nr:LLM class F420-dependent oxidoreductase [Streptomyces pseudovenezuelae]MDH6215979.1 putative F420-dependent oxidoreductase [Streptomyces pseudovenezuelae]
MTHFLKDRVGRHGIWSIGLRAEEPGRRAELAEAVAELEELGYGAVWLGGNSTVGNAVPLIEATSKITVGTSIQSIWQAEATEAAAEFTDVEAAHPGRFALGLGVSHARLSDRYHRPLAALIAYLDTLDTLDAAGVPADRRLIAALGPKSLELTRERAAGSIPYLVTTEHTAHAREILGAAPLLAPELKVVLESDPTRARDLARGSLAPYLDLPNYTNNFLRHGFTDADVVNGGSDRLVDAVFAWGDDDTIRARVDAYLDAGADHVALQVVDGNARQSLPRGAWRRLAALLT